MDRAVNTRCIESLIDNGDPSGSHGAQAAGVSGGIVASTVVHTVQNKESHCAAFAFGRYDMEVWNLSWLNCQRRELLVTRVLTSDSC